MWIISIRWSFHFTQRSWCFDGGLEAGRPLWCLSRWTLPTLIPILIIIGSMICETLSKFCHESSLQTESKMVDAKLQGPFMNTLLFTHPSGRGREGTWPHNTCGMWGENITWVFFTSISINLWLWLKLFYNRLGYLLFTIRLNLIYLKKRRRRIFCAYLLYSRVKIYSRKYLSYRFGIKVSSAFCITTD